MWLWYILGLGYGSVIIAFAMVNSPDLQSPNIVKLCTFWLLIDFGLVILLTVYYFMQYYAFKDKDQALTPEQIEKKFYFFLDTTATKAEGIDQPKPTMQDLVDEVWHNKQDYSNLEQDAYGMAL